MGSLPKLGRFSIGVGDRFEQEAAAQLQACVLALKQGVEVVPVWNKSHREHLIIGSEPLATRMAADAAIQAAGWKGSYFVDADHIRLDTVDRFIAHCDFYTIDVTDSIGQPAQPEEVDSFLDRHPELAASCDVEGLHEPLRSSRSAVEEIARKYLAAVRQAVRVYRHITSKLGGGRFITEVSLDETDAPQTALEFLVLLAALADEAVPIQTIAPRFSGYFHKGIDYRGDVSLFEKQFCGHLAIIGIAIQRYSLPADLKISLHSGSDKFSLYGPIHRALERTQAGLHLKTAGTTWLEEFISVLQMGQEGLAFGRKIGVAALHRIEELCAPYKNVVSIDANNLPGPEQLLAWSSDQFASALRHEPRNPSFNPDLRQLIHVAYKVAAENKGEFMKLLASDRGLVERNVALNLFERHIKPLFLP